MQNSPSKFYHFSFQSYKFEFCYFSLLSFIPFQVSLLLVSTVNFIFYFYIYFLILEKTLIKKNRDSQLEESSSHTWTTKMKPHPYLRNQEWERERGKEGERKEKTVKQWESEYREKE